MQRLTAVGLVDSDVLISAPCNNLLTAIVQHCRQKDILYRVAFDSDTGSHIQSIIELDRAIATATGEETAVVVEAEGVDFRLVVFVYFFERSLQDLP